MEESKVQPKIKTDSNGMILIQKVEMSIKVENELCSENCTERKLTLQIGAEKTLETDRQMMTKTPIPIHTTSHDSHKDIYTQDVYQDRNFPHVDEAKKMEHYFAPVQTKSLCDEASDTFDTPSTITKQNTSAFNTPCRSTSTKSPDFANHEVNPIEVSKVPREDDIGGKIGKNDFLSTETELKQRKSHQSNNSNSSEKNMEKKQENEATVDGSCELVQSNRVMSNDTTFNQTSTRSKNMDSTSNIHVAQQNSLPPHNAAPFTPIHRHLHSLPSHLQDVSQDPNGNVGHPSSSPSQNVNENMTPKDNGLSSSDTPIMMSQSNQYTHYNVPSTPSPYNNFKSISQPMHGILGPNVHQNVQSPYSMITNKNLVYPAMNGMTSFSTDIANIHNITPHSTPTTSSSCNYVSSPQYGYPIVNQSPSIQSHSKIDLNVNRYRDANSTTNCVMNQFPCMTHYAVNANITNSKLANNSMNMVNPSPPTANVINPMHNSINPMMNSPMNDTYNYPPQVLGNHAPSHIHTMNGIMQMNNPSGNILNSGNFNGYTPTVPFGMHPNQGMRVVQGPISPPESIGIGKSQNSSSSSLPSFISNGIDACRFESKTAENVIIGETDNQDVNDNASRKRRHTFQAIYDLEPNKIHKINEISISHSKAHDGSKIIYYHCNQPGCTYKAKQKCDYTQHQRLVHEIGENIPWFQCDQPDCKYKTKRKGDLKIHQRLVHMMGENITWFYCDQSGCKYHSKNKNNLKQHKLLVHSIGENIVYFRCDQPGCDYSTKRKRDFTRHKMNLHSIGDEIIWHYCDQPNCDYKAKQKSNLTQHKRVIHDVGENIIRYTCDQDSCTYSTKIKGDLVRHQRLVHHIGDTNIWFYCDYPGCHYRCNIKTSIKQHKRNIHEKHLKVQKALQDQKSLDESDQSTKSHISTGNTDSKPKEEVNND